MRRRAVIAVVQDDLEREDSQSARLGRWPPRSPRSRCHSAHQRPQRGSSEPARVSDMLGQTDYRRQSTSGTGTQCHLAAPARRRPARPEPIRSGRGGGGRGKGGAGTLLRVAEGEALEDLPDDRGIVQRGDQAEAAATLGTRQHIDAERPVHQGSPAPGVRTALQAWALWTFGPRRYRGPGLGRHAATGWRDTNGWKPGCLRARLWSPTPPLWSLLPGLHPGGEAA
jgi:hypothetical protein